MADMTWDDGRPGIGVDIGGTKIAGALVAPDGTILERVRLETPAEDVEAIIATTTEVVEALQAACDGEVAGIGVAVAALVDVRRGHVWFAPNISWRDCPLGELLEARLGRPVVVENDANAAAWGEFRFGAGQDTDDMVLFTIGTGVGGGCVVDGRLLHGAFGTAGELGHVTLDPDGPRCGCGNKGCLEVYASGTALLRDARELIASASPSAEALRERCGGDPEALSGRDIDELADAGDEASVELLAELGRRLGHGMASVCAVLDPELVVVGGGVSAAGDLLVEPARAAFGRHLVGRGHRPAPTVVTARLGNDAGVVGAAALACERGR